MWQICNPKFAASCWGYFMLLNWQAVLWLLVKKYFLLMIQNCIKYVVFTLHCLFKIFCSDNIFWMKFTLFTVAKGRSFGLEMKLRTGLNNLARKLTLQTSCSLITIVLPGRRQELWVNQAMIAIKSVPPSLPLNQSHHQKRVNPKKERVSVYWCLVPYFVPSLSHCKNC